jgi:hypothetical protein
MNSTTEILTTAGIGLDQLPDAQRDVLTSLSPDEASVLASIKTSLDEAGDDDVEGHAAVLGGVMF